MRRRRLPLVERLCDADLRATSPLTRWLARYVRVDNFTEPK